MNIVLKNAGKSFNALPVLEQVSFSLNQGDKVAVIGENGAGKSTLLRLLADEEEPSSGYRSTDGYVRIASVRQDFPIESVGADTTGEEFVLSRGSDSLLRNTKRNMKLFGLDEKALRLPLGSLSGGQQKIIDLSVAFAEYTDFVFLDEPENHIDIFARQALILLMKEYRGGLVFVSHDQDLINSVTNRIAEVEDGRLMVYKGSYEFYLEEKARQEAGKKRAWETHARKVEQLDKLIKRMHQWVKLNPDLGAQLRSRKTQLARLQEKAPPKPKKHKRISISLSEAGKKSSKRVLIAEGLTIRRGDRDLIWKASCALFYGDKVGFVGKNGSGKTSFLKAIMGEIPFDGTLRTGESVKVGYFSQSSADALDPDATPLEALEAATGYREQQLRSMLAQYLIGPDHCSKPIRTLSGGQKTRLRFCMLFAARYDLLLLDEPTNHLDPVTWGIVAQALMEFEGAVILVSHDRVFIDQTVKQLWVIEDQHIELFSGTLSEYLEEGL